MTLYASRTAYGKEETRIFHPETERELLAIEWLLVKTNDGFNCSEWTFETEK